eukprot:TRINITY_DN15622_c0_g1_i1.p1 TRINITY_DN15622_c0_g1~~TRINITY_DN15622_c0_g1_i1.p1  ORF type:complete len:367 (-),score=98.76 TRINITY_DN15622_c0_g1_i1:65-1141(-)
MAEEKKNNMIYRYLGGTGLKVSVFSYGNWVNSHNAAAEEEQTKIIKRAFELGVNYFDTAEIYGYGTAETLLGTALAELGCKRSDIVVSTKLFKIGDGPNESFMSRKHIIEGLQNSLQRLKLDYVDIVFSHRPDFHTPIEETCRAFHTLVEQGKALYWGTSEWPIEMILEAIHFCDKHNLHKPVVEQCQYNAFVRTRMEKEYEWIFDKYKYGTTIWSPLASGILSGKYNTGEIPKDSRLDTNQQVKYMVWPTYFGTEEKTKNTLRTLQGLEALAKEQGYTQAQLALAWAVANPDTSTCLLGASRVEQFEENVKALELLNLWNKDLEEKVEAILQNTPETSLDFKTWKPRKGRRQAALGF